MLLDQPRSYTRKMTLSEILDSLPPEIAVALINEIDRTPVSIGATDDEIRLGASHAVQRVIEQLNLDLAIKLGAHKQLADVPQAVLDLLK